MQTQQIDIDCISDTSCKNLNICSRDGDVNINCLGQNTCFNNIFCQDILILNQTCSGSNSCQTKSQTMRPTIKPTLSLTVETFAPSQGTIKTTNNSPIIPKVVESEEDPVDSREYDSGFSW